MKTRSQMADWPRSEISRRRLLQGALGATSAALVAGFPGSARAVGRLSLGGSEILTVTDGKLAFPMSFFYGSVPKEELDEVLTSNNLPTDVVRPDCNVTILKREGRTILFDAGSGPHFMETAGRLPANLEAEGIDLSDVSDVIFTHAHPDHIWGVLDEFDDLLFPNAAFHIGQAEFDFWTSPDVLDQIGPERQSFVSGAQTRLEALSERMNFIKPGDEVIPGVEAIRTFGHTQGHLSYAIHDGSEQLVVIGDAISHSAISFAHPEWQAGSDHQPDVAAETRTALLDRLAAEKAHVVGYHFPDPGAGIVEKSGGAYRFTPLA
ncbi:Metallo-beta-lactamase superfamily protein [Hartmannibacter diazotrophicus]|uniref:Metallo-beta-lactamase superfamily protein n=1 Tax=Hartmannibacter diazotrophicus TaxID=1482074 RepID=A0A2C9DB97_9HYPH|nr:MBL fold metallo-hydrolase [Hartmannibacter diazotrophicus]SON57440.1 Metallo-beta-lactamase superfamily protein [Hartmannibacter diazotrophicus]